MIAQLFCRHKYKSIRRSVDEIKKVAQPELPAMAGYFSTVKNFPIEFYTVKRITEVFMCEKCGHTHTIYF